MLGRNGHGMGNLMQTFSPVGLLSLLAVIDQFSNTEGILYDTNRAINSGRIAFTDAFYALIAEDILTNNPDITGFMTECDSYHHVLRICDELKRRRPALHVVLGGPHASAVASDTMQRFPQIDSIFVGEAEESFRTYIDALLNGKEPGAKGVHVRRDGHPWYSGPEELISSLDMLPVPAYAKYSPADKEEIFLEVGRGCPFSCSFCSTAPFWRRRHRTKSPERIIAELRFLLNLYGNRRFHFTHDLFTANRAWVSDVCAAISQSGIEVEWTCSARTDTVDRKLLASMRAAGCTAIYFGLESGSRNVLRQIGKDITFDESLAVLATCLEIGIRPNCGFIVGLPEDSEMSIQDTFAAYERCLRSGSKPVHIFGFCPFRDAKSFAMLKNPVFDGHFLDIPLPTRQQERNRRLIGSSFGIFGGLWRNRVKGVQRIWMDELKGIDEFSPLVESALLPTLMLAEVVGGMGRIYGEWVKWLSTRANLRSSIFGCAYYGSEDQYFSFLTELAERSGSASLPIVDFVRLLRIARTCAGDKSSFLSIENYRSFRDGRATHRGHRHTTQRSADESCEGAIILNCVRLRHDVTSWLNAEKPEECAPLVPTDCTVGFFTYGFDEIRYGCFPCELEPIFHILKGRRCDRTEILALIYDLFNLSAEVGTHRYWADAQISKLTTAGLLSKKQENRERFE